MIDGLRTHRNKKRELDTFLRTSKNCLQKINNIFLLFFISFYKIRVIL